MSESEAAVSGSTGEQPPLPPGTEALAGLVPATVCGACRPPARYSSRWSTRTAPWPGAARQCRPPIWVPVHPGSVHPRHHRLRLYRDDRAVGEHRQLTGRGDRRRRPLRRGERRFVRRLDSGVRDRPRFPPRYYLPEPSQRGRVRDTCSSGPLTSETSADLAHVPRGSVLTGRMRSVKIRAAPSLARPGTGVKAPNRTALRYRNDVSKADRARRSRSTPRRPRCTGRPRRWLSSPAGRSRATGWCTATITSPRWSCTGVRTCWDG